MPPPPDWSRTRVIKKYPPHQPGARKLALRYGEALVCVRHRHAFDGKTRYTTVELLVEQLPIASRKASAPLVAIRLDSRESEVRRQVISQGGRWDMHLRVWWIARDAAVRLRLTDRVVAAEAP